MVGDDGDNENTDKKVQEYPHFYNKRYGFDQQHAENKYTVFQHKVPHNLREGLEPGNQNNESHQDRRERSRHNKGLGLRPRKGELSGKKKGERGCRCAEEDGRQMSDEGFHLSFDLGGPE